MPGMERAVAWRRGTVRSGDAWYLEVCTCRGASTNFRLPTKLAVIEAHLLRSPIGSSGLVVGHPTEGASYFDPKNPEPRRVWEDCTRRRGAVCVRMNGGCLRPARRCWGALRVVDVPDPGRARGVHGRRRCWPFTWTKDPDTVIAKATDLRRRKIQMTLVTEH